LRRPFHAFEPGIAFDVQGNVPEGRRVDAINLEGLRAAGSVRRMEDVRLLPRAHGIVQGRNHPVADQGRDGQERGLVEDLVVRLAGRRVLLLRPEGVDLGFEVPHLSVVEHRCENERPGRLRALWASEDVYRFRDETAAAHVARLGLRVAVLDVALFILELPDLDHEEIALADPHPFLQPAKDTTAPSPNRSLYGWSCFLMCRRISYGSPNVAFDSIQYFRDPFISSGLCIRMSGVLSYFARRSFSVSYWRPRALSQAESFASP